MKNKRFICLLFLLSGMFPAAGQEQDNSAKAEDIVNFLEYLLNTLGDPKTSARDKDVIVTESYTKIFRDAQVQVEDDLDENRDVITNKDVTAYLKDVNFFFRKVTFDFEIQDIEENVNEEGEQYLKVSLQRNLQGITVTGDTVNQTIPRFIEININPEDRDLRIASIYTNELDQNQAWRNWWADLSYEWRSIFREKLQVRDSASLSQIKSLAKVEELDLTNNQYITDLRPLSRISALKKLSIEKTRVTSIVPIRNLNKLEELNISHTGVADITALKYASAMRIFKLSHSPVQDISVFSRMPNLEIAELDGTFILDFTPLADLQNLTVLLLNQTEFSDYSLLRNKPSLQILDISATSAIQVQELATITSLRQLYADSTSLASVRPLTALTELDLLSINYTQVADISPLASLDGLKRIYCDHTGITREKAREFMITNPDVLVVFETEDLRSWWNGLAPAWQTAFKRHVPGINLEDKEGLAQITSLDSLHLAGIRAIDDLRPLTTLIRLSSLNVSGTGITDLDDLAGMRDMTWLDFSKTGVSNVSPLLGLSNLTYINADETQVRDITPLHTLAKINLFRIDRTNIPDSAALTMARLRPSVLIIFKTERLNAWWGILNETWKTVFRQTMNWKNEPDAMQLHALVSRESLETHDPGIRSLEPLKEFVRLEKLDIAGIGLSDLSALAYLPTLKSLNVARNPISEPDPIRNLYNLEYLDISNTPVESLDFLENLMELLHVNVSGTQIKRVDPLQSLWQLNYLDCSNTNVKRIDALLGLSLQNLKCYNTRISDKRVEEFKQLNPDCSVSYY